MSTLKIVNNINKHNSDLSLNNFIQKHFTQSIIYEGNLNELGFIEWKYKP
jgi:hypothetical protein